jgi:hypothetical protein
VFSFYIFIVLHFSFSLGTTIFKTFHEFTFNRDFITDINLKDSNYKEGKEINAYSIRLSKHEAGQAAPKQES